MSKVSEPHFTAHQKAALDYDRHISLTANAGSGKTFVLTQRYLAIVRRENIRLNEIVAITYTKKAASELYRDIAKTLQEMLANVIDDSERLRLEEIRGQLISAHISTIHSFCSELLREFPVEAGIDPGFISLSAQDENALLEQCVYDVLNDKSYHDQVQLLVHLYGTQTNLREGLMTLVRAREKLVSYLKMTNSASVEELEQFYRENFMQMVEGVLSVSWEPFITALRAINDAVLEDKPKQSVALNVRQFISSNTKFQLSEILINTLAGFRSALLTKAGNEFRKREYCPAKISNDYPVEMETVVGFFGLIGAIETMYSSETNIYEQCVKVVHPLITVLNASIESFQQRKLRLGFVDFTDMLIFLKELLHNADVRKTLADRFKYIMIDEFQDTNDVQLEIFLALLDDLKRGNLFVVGDEKQSIYMFRNAELSAFERTKKIIKDEAAGDLLSLPDSFRMAPNICLFVNSLFEKLFEHPREIFNEVQFSETVCARQDDFGGEVELLISDAENEQALSQDELVCRRILRLKREYPEVKWSDIAILYREHKNSAELCRLFSRCNIPYLVSGGRNFYQDQIFYDVIQYLEFLLSPANDVALIAILRSPFFMVSDAELLNIRAGNSGLFYQKLRKYCEVNQEADELRRICSILEKHIEMSSISSVYATLSTIFDDTMYIPITRCREQSDQHLDKLRAIFTLADEFERNGFHNLYDFKNYLIDTVDNADRETQSKLSIEEDVIHLMTIHASKGLQFPIVFLIKTESPIRKSSSRSVVFIDKTLGIISKLPGSEDFFEKTRSHPLYNLAVAVTQFKEEAESKRLLYVALTRARDRLYVSASAKIDAELKKSHWDFIRSVFMPFNFHEGIVLKNSIQRLRDNDGVYRTEAEKLEYTVAKITFLDEEQAIAGDAVIRTIRADLNPLPAYSTGAVITASHYLMFRQCPMKYYLNYRMKLGELLEDDCKFSFDEEDENITTRIKGTVKGIILHKLIELDADEAACMNTITEMLGVLSNVSLSFTEIEKTAREIQDIFMSFRESGVNAELRRHLTFKTEYSIFTQEPDCHLMGTIDRLIFTDETLILVDFKSNTNPRALPSHTHQEYSDQLEFYVYITSKMFPAYEKFETRLIFIADDNYQFVNHFTRADVERIHQKIRTMKLGVESGQFTKNTDLCSRCRFADVDEQCIVK